MRESNNIIRYDTSEEGDVKRFDVLDEVDEDLWKLFIESYENRYGTTLPKELKSIKGLIGFVNEGNDIDDIFDKYMITSLKVIIINMTNLMYSSLKRFEKSIKDLDEKSVFVIMDKLSYQIKSLNELYNKISARNKNVDKTDFGDIKEL
ncbi:MAG: hypothetical protein QXS19_09155 [Candidatus Methanomethylicia archaeon]